MVAKNQPSFYKKNKIKIIIVVVIIIILVLFWLLGRVQPGRDLHYIPV